MNLYRRDARPSKRILSSIWVQACEVVFAQGNIPRLEELKPGYEDHSETAQRIDLDRACRSNLEEEKARKSAPEVQCRKFKICEQCREVCARRRKTSTTEWLGARSLRTILDRWGPPHIEPEAEPPEQLYWDDGGDHGFICAGQYSAGFSPR